MYLNLIVLLATVARTQVYYATSSGTNIVNLCHCDLTKSFCDFNCCCDNDCSSTTNAAVSSCVSQSFPTYCLDPSYYAYINIGNVYSKVQYSADNVCYSFNVTGSWQSEVSLTAYEISSIISANTMPIVTGNTFASGYTTDVAILTISSAYVLSTGACNTASLTTSDLPVYFGQNRDFVCADSTTCNSASTPPLFSQFAGQSIVATYIAGSSNNVTISIPSLGSNCTTSLTVVVYYDQLGISSNPLYYILSVKTIQSSSSTTTKSVKLRFININSNLRPASATGPSFFPRLPQDIFYPIIYTFQLMASAVIVFCILI